jgi:WD40 repeat protein
VQVWDAVSGRRLCSFDQIGIERLAFSSDGQMLAAAGYQGVIVWSMTDGRELSNTLLSGYRAHSVAFSPDSPILADQFRNTVTLIEMPSGRGLNTFQHASDVMGFAFLPDGKSLITVIVSEQKQDDTTHTIIATSTFTVWDIDSGQAVRTFTQPGGINNLVVSPDGKSLAAGSRLGLLIWDMESGRELQVFTGFQFGVPRFAFSPNGGVLAGAKGWDLKGLHRADCGCSMWRLGARFRRLRGIGVQLNVLRSRQTVGCSPLHLLIKRSACGAYRPI